MCGITGAINKSVFNILYESLKRLEYRGYDSSGILIYDNMVHIKKTIGVIDNLLPVNFDGSIGMAHTRWATNGEVKLENSHPHHTKNKRIYVVHNGVINNYLELKKNYKDFLTDVDSEIICHMLEDYLKELDMLNAIKKLKQNLVGSYALILFDSLNPTFLFALSNELPLYLGLDSFIISSDLLGLLDNKRFIDLEGYILKLGSDYKIYNDNLKNINLKIKSLNNSYNVSLCDYKYFMEKEILEIPYIIDKLINKYKKIKFKKEKLNIVGCGSSFIAAKASREILKGFDIDVYSGGEFKYGFTKRKTILISQSGETKDIKNILKYKIKKFLITNNLNSSIAKKVKSFDLCCDKEISVASTKCFFSTVFLFEIFYLRYKKRKLDELFIIKNKIIEEINNFKYIDITNKVIILGDKIDYILAKEFELKLREIAYIEVIALRPSELKHGSISIVDDKTTVISLVSNEIYDNSSNIALNEAKSRGAIVYKIKRCYYKSYLSIIVIMYLISLNKAKRLNRNIDRPKNLAKSVTVD